MAAESDFEVTSYGELEHYSGNDEVVSIPEGVWKIGKRAFCGNDRMRRIDLSHIEFIDDEAFMDCDMLEGIVITNRLIFIGTRAFKGCHSLRSVELRYVKLRHAELRHVEFMYYEIEDEEQPEGLEIYPEAFHDCTSLERVDLHLVDGDLMIGYNAFDGCTALTTVKLSNTIDEYSFGTDVFLNCTNLKRVSLPEPSLDSTEEEEQAHKTTLRNLKRNCVNSQICVTRPESEAIRRDAEGNEAMHAPLAHAYRSNVRRLAFCDLPEHWRHKDAKGLFEGFASLEEIDLEGMEEMVWHEESLACMFKGCAELREIDLSPISLADARDLRHMFFGCRSLRSLDFSNLSCWHPEDMSHLLHNCRSLERVNLGDLDLSRVRSLWSAFDGCESLVELDLSQVSMPALEKGGYLFRGCRSLRSVDLTGLDLSRAKSLPHVFDGCGSLEQWTVSETWPVNMPGAIPEPTADCSMWWSARRREWMTVEQIHYRGPMADTYTNEPPVGT